ncbi:unnamed protein product [Penicillium salamii]|uniref:AB hydrolase-1 domain-containing protein n=1 Tax=Penicillium salamii TaxID=1612424 RepID=A0A9W4I786_9EURO|nr:unnamed protein product [Penicillium salamii]
MAEIVQQSFWDLGKQPIPGFDHAFMVLRNGRRLHYIHNKHSIAEPKSLIIFFHGFPDSCVMWRHIVSHKRISKDSIMVCVDLPGYGGSDSFDTYDTSVIESLCEFCISIQGLFCTKRLKTLIVAHDWGCNLAIRLATEAPTVADHFVLMNGLFTDLAIENFTRHVQMLPGHLSHLRLRSLSQVSGLLLCQIWKLAYVLTFDLPEKIVGHTIGVWNQMVVLRGLVRMANIRNFDFDFVQAMAASLGPSERDAETKTGVHFEGYSNTVMQRARSPAALLWQMTGLYRNGVLRGLWLKSKETLASMPTNRIHPHAVGPSSGEINEPRLQAPATIIWGIKDHVLMPEICLDGIHKYLAPGSEVISLPRTGHWVPVETESIQVILEVLRYHTNLHLQGNRLAQDTLKQRYKDARLVTRT